MPGKPTMMISTTMGNTALIQWQPPKEMVGEMTGYLLQYKRVEEGTYISRDLRKTDDHYTATGLHKGATYVFRLSARNRAGLGEAYIKEISTPEDVPSGFPLNLKVTGLTQSSTQLTWEPPLLAERNGKIIYYVVVYRDINSQQNRTNRTADTNFTILGLNPDTTYDIRLQAYTNKGGGPLSPSIQSRTMSNGRLTFIRKHGRSVWFNHIEWGLSLHAWKHSLLHTEAVLFPTCLHLYKHCHLLKHFVGFYFWLY